MRAAIQGDREGYATGMERLSVCWAEQGQRLHAFCAAYRARQARGDLAGQRAVELRIRALEVVAPNRAANLFTGPLPRFGGARGP